jgi:uncharacterized protein
MKVTVRVKSSSKKGVFVQPGLDGELLVHVREPAIDGKANRAVIDLLSDYYDVPKTRIEIVRGLTNPIKVISVDKD